MGRRIKVDVAREHWDEVVRLVASFYAGAVAPSVMLKKLAAYRRQNQLDLALQELGRNECTLLMLDWLESPGLRRRCHAGLNKSEQRHFLAQEICTFNQGRSAEAQQSWRPADIDRVLSAVNWRFRPPRRARCAIYRCSRRPKGPSWPYNHRGSGGMSVHLCGRLAQHPPRELVQETKEENLCDVHAGSICLRAFHPPTKKLSTTTSSVPKTSTS
jgi:hypothetical protein